jgi:NAD(P)H-dependent FMN reductase
LKHRLAIIIGSTRPGRVGPIFAEWLEAVAREHGAAFLDAGKVIRSSPFDGIHLDVDAQAALGNAVADKISHLSW